MANWWDDPRYAAPKPQSRTGLTGLTGLATLTPPESPSPTRASSYSAPDFDALSPPTDDELNQYFASLPPAPRPSAPPVAPPAPEPRGFLGRTLDTASGVASGVVKGLAGIGPAFYTLADVATGSTLDEGRRRAQAGLQNTLAGITGDENLRTRPEDITPFAVGAQQAGETLAAPLQTAGLQQQEARLKGRPLDWSYVKDVLTTPELLGSMAGESLPYMLPVMAPARAAQTAALARGMAPAAAAKLGERVAIGMNLPVSGGTSALGIQQQIYAMPDEQFAQTFPGMTRDEAAQSAGLKTAAISGGLGLGASMLMKGGAEGALLRALGGQGVAQSIPQAFLRGAASEAGEEFLQSGGEQVGENVGLRQPLLEGVPQSAVLGGALGALTGGVFGAGGTFLEQGARNTQADQQLAGLDPFRAALPTATDDDLASTLVALARLEQSGSLTPDLQQRLADAQADIGMELMRREQVATTPQPEQSAPPEVPEFTRERLHEMAQQIELQNRQRILLDQEAALRARVNADAQQRMPTPPTRENLAAEVAALNQQPPLSATPVAPEAAGLAPSPEATTPEADSGLTSSLPSVSPLASGIPLSTLPEPTTIPPAISPSLFAPQGPAANLAQPELPAGFGEQELSRLLGPAPTLPTFPVPRETEVPADLLTREARPGLGAVAPFAATGQLPQPGVPTNAQQVPLAETLNGSRSSQSPIRQEGGRPSESGQGVQPGRPESEKAGEITELAITQPDLFPAVERLPEQSLESLRVVKQRLDTWLERYGDTGALAQTGNGVGRTLIPWRNTEFVQRYQPALTAALDAAEATARSIPASSSLPSPPSPPSPARQRHEAALDQRIAEIDALRKGIQARMKALSQQARDRLAAGEDQEAIRQELEPAFNEGKQHLQWLKDQGFAARTAGGGSVQPGVIGSQLTPVPEALRAYVAPKPETPAAEIKAPQYPNRKIKLDKARTDFSDEFNENAWANVALANMKVGETIKAGNKRGAVKQITDNRITIAWQEGNQTKNIIYFPGSKIWESLVRDLGASLAQSASDRNSPMRLSQISGQSEEDASGQAFDALLRDPAFRFDPQERSYRLSDSFAAPTVPSTKPESTNSQDEQQAIAFGNNAKQLEKRLNEARSALNNATKPLLKDAVFDFENKRLVSSDGKYALQWKVRNRPDKPISYYENQQTSVGIVDFVKLDAQGEIMSPAPAVDYDQDEAKLIALGYKVYKGKIRSENGERSLFDQGWRPYILDAEGRPVLHELGIWAKAPSSAETPVRPVEAVEPTAAVELKPAPKQGWIPVRNAALKQSGTKLKGFSTNSLTHLPVVKPVGPESSLDWAVEPVTPAEIDALQSNKNTSGLLYRVITGKDAANEASPIETIRANGYQLWKALQELRVQESAPTPSPKSAPLTEDQQQQITDVEELLFDQLLSQTPMRELLANDTNQQWLQINRAQKEIGDLLAQWVAKQFDENPNADIGPIVNRINEDWKNGDYAETMTRVLIARAKEMQQTATPAATPAATSKPPRKFTVDDIGKTIRAKAGSGWPEGYTGTLVSSPTWVDGRWLVKANLGGGTKTVDVNEFDLVPVAKPTAASATVETPIGPAKASPAGPGVTAIEMPVGAAAPSPAPARAADYGKANKIFTEDAAAKARELLKRKLGQLNAGLDPEIVQAGITLAGYHIEAGARAFADYARAMINDLGEAARPFLRSWYEGARYYPGFDAEGMSTAEAIAALETTQKATPAETPAATTEPVETAEAPTSEWTAGARRLAESVKTFLLDESGPLTPKRLWAMADTAFGGTQADGRYNSKDAYDAMELGLNRAVLESREPSLRGTDSEAMRAALGYLETLQNRLPTQTRRDAEQQQMQQFSTPQLHSHVVAWVAAIQPTDRVLEPTAGTGNLVTHAKLASPAAIFANELSERRDALLRQIPGVRVFNENANHLHAILPAEVRPTVVVMNPPFSADVNLPGKKKLEVGALHIEQALQRLQPGGRLVAIVGRGMAMDAPRFSAWWKDIEKRYNVRANIAISGREYTKFGTSFDNRILVIDKNGQTGLRSKIIGGEVEKVADLIPLLEGVRGERTRPAQPTSVVATGQAGVAGSERETGTGTPVSPATGGGRGQQARPGADAQRRPGRPQGGAGSVGGSAASESVAAADHQPGQRGRAATSGTEPKSAGPGGVVGGDRENQTAGAPNLAQPNTPLELEAREQGAAPPLDAQGLGISRFESYQPKNSIKGAQPHPTPLVESAAMASVSFPPLTYLPNLPPAVVASGRLSAAQLETISYAGQAHTQLLPNGERRGFFIGDGTGVGKGAQIAGILLDNWNQGRKKAVWISENVRLLDDARRDTEWVGLGQERVVKQNDLKGAITLQEGVIFTTYDTLSSGEKETKGQQGLQRIDQLANWLGADFEGVIAFDEAHNMANLKPKQGAMGQASGSKRASFGVELQRRLPKARIVYVSATGATEIDNLAYTERLGLWGEGTAFSDRDTFMSAIESGGLAAMEVVAKDLKSMGLYTARSLSYDGVDVEMLNHALTPEQAAMYDTLARTWQGVLADVDHAMAAANSKQNANARKRALSAFWGSHQRFFNSVLTSLSVPSLINDAEAELQANHSIVMQLVNTNEATQERRMAQAAEAGQDLEDIDLSPRDVLMQYVQNSFPTTLYEEYQDEEGNRKTRPVFDSAGNAVQDPLAVAMRDKLLIELATLQVPEGVLEQVINHFGSDAVAEITMRKRRLVRQKDGSVIEEKLSPASRKQDAQAFDDGKKRILIFSYAGGTGRSYHADLRYLNQQRRVHYLVQPGWRADKAIQGLGRTHRTNQAQPPLVKPITTELKAQRRFISSIARRMDQMGAITRGQRDANTKGLFDEDANLENQYSQEALFNLFMNIAKGKAEGITVADIEKQMGITLLDNDGNLVLKKIPTIQQFLNRLLSLEIPMMDRVFEAFDRGRRNLIEYAKQTGTYDTGMETLVAESLIKQEDQVAMTHPFGASTHYIKIEATHPITIVTFNELQANGKPIYARNLKSGRLYAFFETNISRTDEKTGAIISPVLRQSPSERKYFDRRDITGENYEKIEFATPAEEKAAWEQALADAPKFRKETLHLLTGALLPIWDRLPQGTARVVRAKTDAGERLLGRVIPNKEINETLRRLGVGVTAPKLTGQQALDALLNDRVTLVLANNWRLVSRTVNGQSRVEVLPPAGTKQLILADRELLESMGGFSEMIAWNYRVFLPTDQPALLDRLIASKPIVEMLESGQTPSPSSQRFAIAATPATPAALLDSLKALASYKDVQALLDAGRLQIVARQRNLPASIVVPPGQRVGGAIDPKTGKIVLIAENIAPDEVANFVEHEKVHGLRLGLDAPRTGAMKLARFVTQAVGLRGILGERTFNDVLAQVGRMRASGHTAINAAYQKATAAMGALNQNPALANEETLAYFLQDSANRNLPLFRRIMAAIRAFLTRAGFKLNLTADDLVALAQTALRPQAMQPAGRLTPAFAMAQTAPRNSTADELLARIQSGEVSELTPDEWAQVQRAFLGKAATVATGVNAPTFKTWFGQSKIVKRDGTPLVMYHGTPTSFTAFNAAKSGTNTTHPTAALGFFFTNAKGHAAAKYGANVMETYLAIEKPYAMTDADLRRIESLDDAKAFRARLEKQGYDGIMMPAETGTRYVAAFRPDQIKFTNNETYTRGKGDMRFAQAWNETPHDAEYLAAVERGDMETAQRMVDEKLAALGAMWHGTPSGDLRGGVSGLHVGTKQAAMEALEARIGIPVDGKGWDGTRKYGETLLAGQKRIRAGEFGKYRLTGHNSFAPEEDYYPSQHQEIPTVGKGIKISMDWKPYLRPVLIVGEMSNRPITAMSDTRANATMKGMLSKGTARRGYYYINEGEDYGSVSAVLPSGEYVRVKLPDPVTYDDAGNVIPLSQRFDRTKQDIRFAIAPGTPPQMTPPPMTRIEVIRRAIQDRFLRFKTVQDWLKQRGINLTPDADVYGEEERSVKRFAAQAQDFRDKTLTPLVQAAGKAGYAVTGGDFIAALMDGQPLPASFKPSIPEYLIAQHAAERNRAIAKINPIYPDGGSGLTDAEAETILARYRALPHFAAFERMAGQFRAIAEGTKRLLLDAGILNIDTVAAWDAAYQHYVPLKGGPDDTPAKQGTGPGNSVIARQRRAMGHDLRDENVLENIFRDRERALFNIEKNKVGKALIKLMQQANNPAIGTVGQPEKHATLIQGWLHEVWIDGRPLGAYQSYNDAKAAIAADSAATGRRVAQYGVRHKAVDPGVRYLSRPLLAENEAGVYIDGQLVRVQLNDEGLARAYNALGVDGAGSLLKFAREYNTLLSKAYTGYNPEFLLVNMARDLTAGTINLTGKYGAGFATKALKHYTGSFREAWRFARDKGDHAWLDRYRKAGGSTGASYLSDLERLGGDINRTFEDAQGAIATWKSGKPGAAVRVLSADVIRKVFGLIESFNQAGENALRLATFRTVIEQGGSEAEAASAAANVTVNFNRRGEMTYPLGALYLFFNPNVQGTQILLDTLLNSPHKRQAQAAAAGLVGLAFLLANLARGGDDEDEERWRRIPGYTKDRNLILQLGEKQVTVPLPYGYGMFWAMGNVLSDLAHGADDGKAGVRLASALFEHFSPLGNPLLGETADIKNLAELMPTLLRMPTDIMINRGGMGAPIMPEVMPWNPGQPDSARKWRETTGKLMDQVTTGLNRLSGGSPYESGAIDVSPETIKYVWRGLTGGAGQFISDTFGLGLMLTQGIAPELRETPGLRKFVRVETVQNARTVFANQANQIRNAVGAFNAAKRAQDTAGMFDIARDRAALLRLGNVLDQFQGLIKTRRQLHDLIQSSEMPLPQKRLSLKAIEQEEIKLYGLFSQVFRKTLH